MTALVKKLYVSRYFLAVFLLWVIYSVLSLLAPATQAINQYRVNLVQLNLLRVSILVPLLLIWLAATYAVVRFQHYSKLVAGSKEGPGFKRITTGIWLLFLVLVIPSFVALISNFYPESHLVEKWVTIARLYTTIVLYLGAFWFLFQGSKYLNRTLAVAEQAIDRNGRWAGLVLAVFMVTYAWAIFHNQYRTFSNDPLIKPTYFLSDWLIISTIFVPYIVMWLWGIWTVINFHAYAKEVSGIVYRKAFSSLTRGLTAIVLLLVLLQLFSQSSTVFGRASLHTILIIIYILVLAIAVGYIFLARGAKHLTSIEEV